MVKPVLKKQLFLTEDEYEYLEHILTSPESSLDKVFYHHDTPFDDRLQAALVVYASDSNTYIEAIWHDEYGQVVGFSEATTSLTNDPFIFESSQVQYELYVGKG